MIYIQSFWKRQVLLLILTVMCGKSNSLNVTELTPSCLYFFPHDAKNIGYDEMKPPNGICKSVATYSRASKLHPPRGDLNVDAFKGKLPYVYVYDQFSFDEFRKKINPTNFQDYVVELIDCIATHKIDVFVFDLFSLDNDDEIPVNLPFQDDLVTLCDTITESHPNISFGLKLHINADVVKQVVNLGKLDKHFILYIIPTYWYKTCKYDNDAEAMPVPPLTKQIDAIINKYRMLKYDLKKMFITAIVYVTSLKNRHQDVPDFWSYQWMCKAEPGGRRRYCRGSLMNIYYQGKVVYDNKLAGVIIEAVDCDDFKGTCGCHPWPASKCVHDGVNGCKVQDKLANCKHFGLLPDER